MFLVGESKRIKAYDLQTKFASAYQSTSAYEPTKPSTWTRLNWETI